MCKKFSEAGRRKREKEGGGGRGEERGKVLFYSKKLD